ncbi:MFS transporter [Streptomyces sp. AA0539]|uniref:MFS transporter n=1 Tax=Streptomyces sp. AA0539 TaxID=1210045 RepID=UPI000301AAA1|nr:MFS transporter [Streptomyces sp. AA0539]
MSGRRIRFLDLRPLRTSRPFRALWIGASLGSAGHQIATVAVLAQVWELTRSPLWTGAIGLATAGPALVCGLAGGSLADAMDRRTLVRATTAVHLLAALALLGQALAGNRSVLLLLALVGAAAGASALGAPARRTFPVRLLPSDQLAAGLALQGMAFQVSMLAGPALAGLLLARWDFPAAYGCQAAALVVSLAVTFRLPPMPVDGGRPAAGGAPAAASGGRPRRPERGGWGFILRRPTLWGSFATDLSATLLAMPISLFPLVNEARFDGDPRTLGLFLSAVAVGGITAGLFSGTVTRLRRAGLVQLTAALVWGLALAVFGLAGPLWLALGALAVAGGADTISVVTRGALVQLETPDRYRGRVSSVEHIIGMAGPEAGNFRGGLVASLTSAPVALVTGGLAGAVAVGVVAAVNRPLRSYTLPEPDAEQAPPGKPDPDTDTDTDTDTGTHAGRRPEPGAAPEAASEPAP